MKLSWQSFEQETLDNLRALIRLDTSNPPGNERLAADFMAGVLARAGVASVLCEAEPGRTNLVARIKGGDGANAPLMLSAHTDVVPVEAERWSRAPFGGEVAEGCVWGRGALDLKGKCAMDLGLVAALKRAGAALDRDLILAAVADEEAGSALGARFLVERHPDLVRAGYVLNEVGGFTFHLGARRLYPVQVAERGFVTLKMTVRRAPGHGAMPRTETAVTALAELITRVAHTPMPTRVTPVMREVLAELGVTTESAPAVLRPMLSNTATPTMMGAGYKDNVIPGEAWVVLDGRTLPGESAQGFITELRRIIGNEPELEILKSAPAVEASADTPLYRLIVRRLEAADPGARAIPWMQPGSTDSKFYAHLGATCYGFAPVKLEAQTPFGVLYHGNDERVPVAGFLWGLRVYSEVVLDFLGLKFADIFD